MDLPWGDKTSRKFVTNVGLITSTGKFGDNITSIEWTHHLSYNSGWVGVVIKKVDASHENIHQTKEFGINLAADDQNVFVSVAGNNSGMEYDKISALKELGLDFYKAKKINVFMVKDAALNVECKVVKEIDLPTHTMFIGEAVESSTSEKSPLAYHDGKFWKLTEQLQKPDEDRLKEIKTIIEKYRKK